MDRVDNMDLVVDRVDCMDLVEDFCQRLISAVRMGFGLDRRY